MRIQEFVAGRTWEEHAEDVLLRSAVERQFEIAGEAMSVLRKEDSETAERVPGVHRIVGMRNVLIHGYAEINDLTVWRTATGDLNALVTAADALLIEAGPPATEDGRGA